MISPLMGRRGMILGQTEEDGYRVEAEAPLPRCLATRPRSIRDTCRPSSPWSREVLQGLDSVSSDLIKQYEEERVEEEVGLPESLLIEEDTSATASLEGSAAGFSANRAGDLVGQDRDAARHRCVGCSVRAGFRSREKRTSAQCSVRFLVAHAKHLLDGLGVDVLPITHAVDHNASCSCSLRVRGGC